MIMANTRKIQKYTFVFIQPTRLASPKVVATQFRVAVHLPNYIMRLARQLPVFLYFYIFVFAKSGCSLCRVDVAQLSNLRLDINSMDINPKTSIDSVSNLDFVHPGSPKASFLAPCFTITIISKLASRYSTASCSVQNNGKYQQNINMDHLRMQLKPFASLCLTI